MILTVQETNDIFYSMKDDAKPQTAYLYLVKTPVSNDVSLCASDKNCTPGTYVVYPTRYGLDMGIIICSASNLKNHNNEQRCGCGACGMKNEKVEISDDVDWIDHVAHPEEIARFKQNSEEEKKAVEICKEKILKHKLDMKLVAAHFLLSEPKVLFFFTAEKRVDFRELVKDLVSVFKVRIELRQIGVRDEARFLGGLSVCGRDFCCHSISDKLNPVTIKMAKEQNLSLNSVKISGPCGRLLCCLNYEYDFYVEEKASYPTEGTRLKIGNEICTVQEINVITRKVTAINSGCGTIVIPRKELNYNSETRHWEVSGKFAEEFCNS